MSKKILKRSLVMGTLMAFVITGNAWANSYEIPGGVFSSQNSFVDASTLGKISGSAYCNFTPKCVDSNPNIIVTTGDITYTSSEAGGYFGLYGNMSINKTVNGVNWSNANPSGNLLEIKHNITVKNGATGGTGDTNLYAGAIGSGSNSGYDGITQGNIVCVGVEDRQISITSGGTIYISGTLVNNNYSNGQALDNLTIVNNVKLKVINDSNVDIYGAEARDGTALRNKVILKDVIIDENNTAQIYGGIARVGSNAKYRDASFNEVILDSITVKNIKSVYAGGSALYGNANSNTVSISGDSNIAGFVYGGYSSNGSANSNTINIKDTADLSGASLYGSNKSGSTGNTLNIGWDSKNKEASAWSGEIGSAENFNIINMYKGSDVAFGKKLQAENTVVNIYGATWNITQEGNKVGTLTNNNNGKIAFDNDGHLDVNGLGNGEVIITEAGKTADNLNTASQLTTVAEKMGVTEALKETTKVKVVMEAGDIVGKTVGEVVFEKEGTEGEDVNYYHGVVKKVTEEINSANKAVSDAGISLKLHYRYHMNDMNKRMGELRNAKGEYGVWTRMVRGECEYENTNAQYNQYQLGYDKKLSADKRWTVGAAVTFSDGNANYGFGSTEDKSTAFAVYGSKLNDNGTFVDLIARYVRLESDITDISSGKGDYSTDGMSVSAEFGKRIQKGNGFWIEPQVELTYGTIDSAEFKIDSKNVHVGKMDSLISRVGFSLGKDIKQGNVYARASYLYDFDGETENIFSKGSLSRTIKEDLGGGWWEVGLGANINLSKATYIYADVEKAFSGAVDTNWQWNLGVRYSF